MKYFVLLVVLFGVVDFSQQLITRRQMDEMLLELVWKCQEKEGATNDDVEHMKTRTPPETRGQKCLFACIGESIGLLKDGKIDSENSIKMAENAFGPNDPKIAIAQSMSTECGAISDPDRCELAAKGYECGVESAKKHGFKFSDFI